MRILYGFLVCSLFISCQLGSTNKESLDSNETQMDAPDTIFTDRLMISGDFDGDGKVDTLKESFISSLNGKEIHKYVDLEYDSLVALTVKKEPISRLISESLKPLIISKDDFQLFGLSYLKNEGDLDHNGTDEIGLVIDWADWSSLNTYIIYTYKNNNWIELFNFEIRDFDIDDLKNNKDSQGLLFRNTNGDLIIKTYDSGEQIEKKIDLKNFQKRK
jgi:hypothetical protein